MKFFWFVFFICFSAFGFTQDYAKINELKADELNHPKDTMRIGLFLNEILKQRPSISRDSLMAYTLQIYEISKLSKFNRGLGISAVNLGNIYTSSGDYSKALNYLLEAEKIYSHENKYDKLATIYNIIGNTYLGTGNLEMQKVYFSKCYEIAIKHNITQSKAYGAGGLGGYYSSKKEYMTAIKWTMIAAKIFKESNSKVGYIICLINVASYYRQLDELKKAEEYIQLAYQLLPEIDLNYASFLCYSELGDINDMQKKYTAAIENYKRALDIILLDKANHNISEIYKRLSEVSVKANQYPQAINYLKLHIQYKDSVFNENSNKQLVEVKEKYETEKKDVEIKILNKQNALSTSELNRKKIITYSSIGFTILVLVLFVFVINSNIRKNKTNALLENQNIIIEGKQKEIVDSINYAKRIQETLLAKKEMLKQFLPEHFILFEPKDIVSGDFYWLTHKDTFTYLAICDCTGHGVPGAFMSLLSSNLLNEAINEKSISNPAHILNYVREKLINNLDGGNDGMDAILIKLPDSVTSLTATSQIEIEYAAANNKLIMVRENVLNEFPTDKMPVGKGERTESFKMHTITAKKNDVLYMYTDGYADQFGGEKGKKFKYKNLNQLLVSISTLTPLQQETTLRETFTTWKGNLEQVDDVCVVGIRL